MQFKSIIQGSLVLIFLSTSAFSASKEIPCPPANLIKNSWQQIDTVTIASDKTYFVSSADNSTYDEGSKLWWSTASISVNAQDFNAAFIMGQNNLKNIFSQKDQFAMETPWGYLCRYLDNAGNYTSYIMADKKEHGNKIKEAIVNLQKNS